MPQPTLLVHGGAGTLRPDRLTPDLRRTYKAGLQTALLAGQRLLTQGAPSLVCRIRSSSPLGGELLIGRHTETKQDSGPELEFVSMTNFRFGTLDAVIAAASVLEDDPHLAAVASVGGTGGFIAIDRHGNLALPFNTRAMYRGLAIGTAPPQTAIHAEESAP